jgi:ankyrin repeat protein
VRFLLPNSDLNATDRDGMNSLLLACDSESRPEDVATVELLLDAGADVNSTNNRGQTPLMLAKMNENNDLVKILLDHGATNTANSHKNRKSRKSRRATRKSRKATRKSRKSRKATRRR